MAAESISMNHLCDSSYMALLGWNHRKKMTGSLLPTQQTTAPYPAIKFSFLSLSIFSLSFINVLKTPACSSLAVFSTPFNSFLCELSDQFLSLLQSTRINNGDHTITYGNSQSEKQRYKVRVI